MAPILLKVKGNNKSLPFGNLDSPEDLSKTWRVCTKVKDSLENGTRLENLSWRLWFAHNVNKNKKTTNNTSFEIPENFDFNSREKEKTIKEKEMEYKRNLKLQQQKQAQHLLQEQFTLQKFTSDQAGDQVIELDDIFKNYCLNPQEDWPIDNYDSNLSYDNQQEFYPQSSALYVSAEAMPPIPIGTLHNRLLSTLPKETIESAEKLILSSTENEMFVQSPFIQSTPSTPFLSFSSSSSLSQKNLPQQTQPQTQRPQIYQNQAKPHLQSELLQQKPQYQHLEQRPGMLLQSSTSYSFTAPSFSIHNDDTNDNGNIPSYQSKSLPPSRVSSPEFQTPIIHKKHIALSKRSPISGSPADGKTPICSNCSTTTTPLWRRSVDDELLCNACGLYLKLHNTPRPKHLKPQSSRKDAKDEESIIQPVCSNCGTSTTPLWRRDIDGSPLCNACGLYLKLHHEKRPLSMKTDNIKKRQRTEHANEPKERKRLDTKESTKMYQFMEEDTFSFGINQFNCTA